MTELSLEILSAGLHSSIQDEGRYGHLAIGVPIGGAMDKESMHIANDLAGNNPNSPVIEFTLKGPKIKFTGQGQIALAGGKFETELNGLPINFFETIDVNDGDILNIKQVKNGCRGYLAIRGEWQEEKWLDSYSFPSVYLKSFGLETQLKKGRKIHVLSTGKTTKKSLSHSKRPVYSKCTIIRTVSSPDFERFSIESIEAFYNTVFTVSNQANRMGVLLNEKLAHLTENKEQISSGVIPGTIQINRDGQPMILTADAQSTGGYLRIANILSDDLDLIGQVKPGHEVKFTLVGLESY